MTRLRIETVKTHDLSQKLAQLINSSDDREFGNDPMVYADPEWYLLGYLDGILTTHIGVLQRTITVAKSPLLIAGVNFLVTEPDFRGRGFASALMREAVTFLCTDLGHSFGLLTCKPRLETLYAGIGWRSVPGPTIFVQADGIRSCGGLTMINECGGIPWPVGQIDLCGLPW